MRLSIYALTFKRPLAYLKPKIIFRKIPHTLLDLVLETTRLH